MKTRGFTFVEVAMAATLLVVISGVGLAMVMTGQKVYTTSSNQMQASSRVGGVMERLLIELRRASINAEDIDKDNSPDDLDTEDLNKNGRIDDDWSLADGQTAESISFNMVNSDGLYTDKITYRFDGERLWRDFGSDPSTVQSSVVSSDVTAVTFTRQRRRIIINLVVESGVVRESEAEQDRGGRQVSLVREILLRN